MYTKRQMIGLLTALPTAILSANAVAAQTPVKLVFVHGRAQGGRSSSELADEWSAAFRKGVSAASLPDVDFTGLEVPFYGDELDRLTQEFELPLASEINSRGDDFQDNFLAFQEEVAREIGQQAGVTDQQINDEYGSNPKPRGPQNWEWVQAIIRAIDKNAEGITQGFLETFLRDTFLYINSPLVMRTIDGIVKSAISRQPTIIISHSLGSVVSFNILRQSSEYQVPLLVTLGSPLGIRAIRNRFRPIEHPSSVTSWLNAYDERDVVALYPLDQSNFNVDPAIENIGNIRNQTPNRHGISGYLDKPDIARRIHQTLS